MYPVTSCTFCSHLDFCSEFVNLFRISAIKNKYFLYVTSHSFPGTCCQLSAHFQNQTSQLCVNVYTHRIYLPFSSPTIFTSTDTDANDWGSNDHGKRGSQRAIINNLHTRKFSGLPPPAHHRSCFTLLCVIVWLLSISPRDWRNRSSSLIITVFLNMIDQLSKPKVSIYI